MMPKVSVIIPTYNREQFIVRAINSVLSQIYRDFEIIIVDDGSTDHTKNILDQFNGKIKYIYQDNQGVSAARNRGIQESSGQYIAFLDSDDYWVPEKLTLQVDVLEKNPHIGIVYARMPILNEKGEKVGLKPARISGKNFKELMEVWGDLPTSTVMTRKECFNKAGMFDASLPPMEDIDMWIRISRFYDLYEIENKVLAYYHRHSEQITADKVKVYTGLIKIYTKILKNFDDAPQLLMIKRIAQNRYMLSRTYYDKKNYNEALMNLIEGLRLYPLIGILFFNEKDNIFVKFSKIVKPYVYYCLCFLRKLFHKRDR